MTIATGLPEGPEGEDITRLLTEAKNGGPAEERLMKRVYRELRQMAGQAMRGERNDHTIQATALVHEAYLRFRPSLGSLENRRLFFHAARKAMIRVLIDYAKRRGAQSRTPPKGWEEEAFCFRDEDLDIARSLEALGRVHDRSRAVVEYRYFLGFTVPQVAELLDVSISTVEADWRFAKPYLYARLRPPSIGSGSEVGPAAPDEPIH
jgi:RNA polymerase sigma factor (TIGR02999 family)